MTFYPLSMLTYHLKSCAISSPIFSTASTISRICSPVISSICTPPVQTVTVRQAQQIFSASIRHSTSSLCPVRFHTEEVALQLPSPVSDSRGTACTTPPSRYAAFLLRKDRSENLHRSSLPSLPSCILRLLPFLSAFFPSPVLLYFHAERRKQFGRKMCHHIVDGLRFLIKGHHRRNNPYI